MQRRRTPRAPERIGSAHQRRRIVAPGAGAWRATQRVPRHLRGMPGARPRRRRVAHQPKELPVMPVPGWAWDGAGTAAHPARRGLRAPASWPHPWWRRISKGQSSSSRGRCIVTTAVQLQPNQIERAARALDSSAVDCNGLLQGSDADRDWLRGAGARALRDRRGAASGGGAWRTTRGVPRDAGAVSGERPWRRRVAHNPMTASRCACRAAGGAGALVRAPRARRGRRDPA